MTHFFHYEKEILFGLKILLIDVYLNTNRLRIHRISTNKIAALKYQIFFVRFMKIN